MSSLNVIGTSALRPDAWDKVSGGRGFPVNVRLPGMLHGAILRSPLAHAQIRDIDVSAASALRGVKAVLTFRDVPQRPFCPVYFVPTLASSMVQDFVILTDRVRFAGQPLAAIAATDADTAQAALELIEVDLEELPAVFEPQAAVREGAPVIHDGVHDNVVKRVSFGFGDVDAGFAAADHVFEATYRTQRVHTCYMEPRVCVADSDPEGRITIHSSTQSIFGLREKLAYVLDVPESRVRVVKPPYIGGGFGGKLDLGYIEPLAAWLSLRARRPVRMEQTRHEDFITTTRNPIEIELKTGVTRDGTMTARVARSTLDTGAYATHGPEVIMVHGLFGILFAYACPNQQWEGQVVYTNNIIGGGFRGYGAPQGAFAAESQIDEICDALGLDPIEFRVRNARREGDPHPFNPGFRLATYRFEECLRRGAERIGWERLHGDGDRGDDGRRRPGSHGVKRRGVGVAAHPVWVSGCMGFPDIYEHTGALLKLSVDGTADLATATVDIGSGQITTLCQIAAEAVGLDAEAVRMVYADTDTVPFDAPTHASRVTYSAGNAVRAAADSARGRLLEVAGGLLEVSPDDLEVAHSMVQVRGAPGHAIPVGDVVRRAESPYVVMTAQGPQPTSIEEKGTIIGVSSMAPPSNPSPASAMFVEVEVDTETGQVRVLDAVFAHDLGRVVNPAAAEGQVEGGFQQGMGYALSEHLQFDPDTGTCLTSDFLDYKMPTAVEMPRRVQSVFVESDEPSGPFGAKSLSESCVVVPAPAIANAIYHATGVRVRDLPITPEKILAGLGAL